MNAIRTCAICTRVATPGDDLCAACRELLERADVVRIDRERRPDPTSACR